MLSVTSDQKTQILDPVDTYLQAAFETGVETGATQFLAAIQRFTDLTAEQQALTRATFRLVVAAMLVAMNVKKPLPSVVTDGSGFSGTFSFQDNFGASRQIVIQNGIVTSVS